ncbi:MAG TPA: nuclear transport factor 2 family protein [Nitrososphaeraceae archaeon]|nr:nuclear transport factor 2 family protein [Nitrososphaeraceae archaeon]
MNCNYVSTETLYWLMLRVNEMQNIESSAKSAKDVVMEYLLAAERRDFQSARGYVSDNISYVSPLNSFDRAEPYMKYFEHQVRGVGEPKFDIKKIFADSNDVCILQEIKIGTPPVASLVCFWFHVDDGKISSIRVVLDPRPYVQQK